MAYLYRDLQWEVIYKILSENADFYSRKKGSSPTDSKANTRKMSPLSPENPNIRDIDENLVANILDTKYMNPNNLQALQSMFNTILMHHSSSKNDEHLLDSTVLPYMDKSILEILNSFKLATLNKTSEGYAMISSFKSAKDLLIIKTSKTEETNYSILYEYFIGTMGLNKLRNLIPNFAYTLAIFNCNKLEFEESDISLKNFSEKESVSKHYVVYEKIPGISLKTFVSNIRDIGDIERLFSYLLQILLALHISQTEINFTHYDLHTDNIILRPLEKPIIQEYKIDGKVYGIYTDAIPTIIDYGFSHFVYENVPFGMVDRPELGIVPTVTSSGYDMYKLMMYTISNVSLSDFFDKMEWVISFFDQFEDIYNIQKSARDGDMKGLKKSFKYGSKHYFSIKQKYSKLYNSKPLVLFEWIISSKNFIFGNLVTTRNKDLYEKDEFVKSYQSKVNSYDIFRSELLDNIDDCNILDDKKSLIINTYNIKEIKSILRSFEKNIINSSRIKEKLKSLEKQTDKYKNSYEDNDMLLIRIIKKDLEELPVDKDKILSYINKIEKGSIYEEYKNITKCKKKMKKVSNYIDVYENYKSFVDYSNYSLRLKIDKKLESQYFEYKHIQKEFDRLIPTKIYSNIRENLSVINKSIYDNQSEQFIHPNDVDVNEELVSSLENTLVIFDIIKEIYPTTYKNIKNLDKFIYRLIGQLKKYHSEKFK